MKDATDFVCATGYEPQDDDMDRANCPHAGEPLHMMCGWCPDCNAPRFHCGHMAPRKAASDATD